MKTHTETLRVVWKFIRRNGYPSTRTPKTYCDYIIENKNHRHRKRVYEGEELFDVLKNTRVYKDPECFWFVAVDGVYDGDKLIGITNPRKTC